jgi:hypothetical protein
VASAAAASAASRPVQAKYGYTAQDAPPGARLMQLRMFYIPEEPAAQP